ncbi:MAG TPA: polysaccharide deacetylase family protein [Aggregatilineaceae bacterium]|nr:polysaccharide deacetylase family protein [Aggregatilineaceae bacterium]
MLDRRDFLKWLAVGASGLVMPSKAAGQTVIPVPPTLMLHARQAHLDNLDRLLDWLAERSYTPITYQTLWARLTASQPMPAKPVILTIDDLTMVRGSSNFAFIAKMVDILITRETPAVLGVITQPVVVNSNNQPVQISDQDDDLWATAAGWTEHRLEFATHTESHQNLAAAGLGADDYEREIGGSAAMITERTGQPVNTLVLPFGNGAVDAQEGTLLDPIVTACHDAGIGIVVGVAGGRKALIPARDEEQPIYFVGRVGPQTGAFDGIYWEIEHW